MKCLLPTLALCTVLTALARAMASAAGSETTRMLAVCGLFLQLPLAVWLTATAAGSLPERRFLRVGFWAVTVGAWLAALILMQGHAESSHADEHQNLLVALGLAGGCAGWLVFKERSWPNWRVLGEVAAGIAVLALAGGVFMWGYDAQTRAIAARAEVRWAEIGLPMAEFEKTLAVSHENAGSEVVREVLREQVGTRFYKEGTAAAAREPAVENWEAKRDLVQRACVTISAKLPPSDDLDPSAPPNTATEPVAPALEAAYSRILATEPPTWASDPRDGIEISVPNFLGVRMFSQLTAAESMRRLAAGDADGAARAIAAGRRVSEGLRENPTLVGLMIHVAVESLLAPQQVRLPATADGLPAIARDVAALRAEFLRRMQLEAWSCLHAAEQIAVSANLVLPQTRPLPKWARRLADRPAAYRECAITALNGAGHMAIYQSAATLTLPDLGASLHDAICEKNPTAMEPNFTRAAMRIHATLLLREQTELIRDTRARLATGRTVESRDSMVLPGMRWELTANAEKNTVATRLTGAPDWIANGDVAGTDFWVLPLDGSVAWQFRAAARTASRP